MKACQVNVKLLCYCFTNYKLFYITLKGNQSQIDNSQSSSEFGTNNEYAPPEEYPFERVLNTGIKNLQDMVQTFVTQLSTTIERDLSNKNINVSQPHQSNNDDNSRNVNSNDSQITNSSPETRQVPKIEVPSSSGKINFITSYDEFKFYKLFTIS